MKKFLSQLVAGMNESKKDRPFFYLGLAFFAFLAYAPFFIVEFAYHNDYTMIFNDKVKWLGFVESPFLLMIGRALGAVLVTFQCHFIKRISDFALWRFIAFLAMLIFIQLFGLFLRKRCGVNYFWSIVIMFCTLFLPSVQLWILWVSCFFPGAVNLILAVLSYFLLDCMQWQDIFSSSFQKRAKGIFYLIGSLMLFICSLFIYPPSSLFVFVMTFSIVLFSPYSDWPQTRGIVIRDLAVFGLGMIIYRIIDRVIVFPWGAGVEHFHIPGQVLKEYQMGIVNNFTDKWPLLRDTFLISASGTWHLMIGEWGISILSTVILCSIFAKLSHPSLVNDNRMDQHRKILFFNLQRIFICVILFLMSNLPAILAQGYLHVSRYRAVFPSTAMFLMLELWILINLEKIWQKKNKIPIIKIIAVTILCLAGLLTFRNVMDVTRNCSIELNYIRDQAAKADPVNTKNFIIVKVTSASLIGRELPLDFGLMISLVTHGAQILKEVTVQGKKLNGNSMVYMIEPKDLKEIILSKDDFLIDLNELKRNR